MKIKLFLAAFCFLLLEGYAQWKPSNGPCAGNVTCLAVSQNTILVGTYNRGVFLSDDNGLSWRMINNGLTNLGVNAVLINGTNFLVGTDGGVFMSTDHGATWSLKGLGGSQVTALAVNDSNIFAATYGQGIYISTDNGNSWSEVNNGLTNLYISSLVVNGSTLVAGTIGSGAFVSTNNGYFGHLEVLEILFIRLWQIMEKFMPARMMEFMFQQITLLPGHFLDYIMSMFMQLR